MRTEKTNVYILAVAISVSILLTNIITAQEENPKSVKAYYFGNSLTECSDSKDHEALAKPAGKTWKTWAFLGAGWQLWQHRHALTGGAEIKRDSNGDLTIDPEQIKNTTVSNVKRFFGTLGDTWDAIVLQPFSMGLTLMREECWGVKFDKTIDIGDIACANDIIAIYLKLNPKGKVFIYQDWPAMPPGKLPPQDQLPDWAKKEGARLADAEFPLREKFDYEQSWAKDIFVPGTDPLKYWIDQKGGRSKDYHDKLFAAIREKYPELYKEGRLRVIPVGDIFLELHRKAKADQFDGIKNITEYYTDVQHIRGGLPRYTVAAAFYAALFNERPDNLDWKIYNDVSRYGEDKNHDALPFLEINPARAKIVHDVIWEVMNQHPCAKPGPKTD